MLNNEVTVLIPAYNEEEFIEEAVESIVDQVQQIIISDNCSSDNTVKICKKLSGKYANIVLYEQSENIGSSKNGGFLFSKVKTKFVMCMGAHDRVAPDYVATLLKAFKDKDVVLSYGKEHRINHDGKLLEILDLDDIKGTFSSSPFERVYTIIDKLNRPSISIVFGIFKTNILRQAIVFNSEAAIDHVWLCRTAIHGKFKKSNDTFFEQRIINREENDKTYMKRIQGKYYASGNAKNLAYMITSQIEAIDSIVTKDVIEKRYYCELARKSLKQRYAGRGGRVDYRPVVDSCILKL